MGACCSSCASGGPCKSTKKGPCPSSPDGGHVRDNQDLCHHCGVRMLFGGGVPADEYAGKLSKDKSAWKPLPEFTVVRGQFKSGHLARYMEKAKPQRIELSLPSMSAATLDSRRYIVFHELGHWFRVAYVPMELAETEEKFAEDFATFFVSPSTLKHYKPGSYAVLKLLTGGQTARIRTHAKKMLNAVAGPFVAYR